MTSDASVLDLQPISLHGFAVSNYYNKVKLALLEKEIVFTEVLQWTGKDAIDPARSPLGKVPYLMTAKGPLAESQVILDFLEEAFPTKALLPAHSYERAKIRELCTVIDMHLELPARRLYPQAFFGGQVSEETIKQVRKDLEKGVKAFAQLATFNDFVGGKSLSLADCSAFGCLPAMSLATKAIYGEDLLAGLPIKEYMSRLRTRPSVIKIEADRKANQVLMAERAAAAKAKSS
jgi:glutathione S-transferase